MDFETLIEPAAILPGLRANSKKQVLQELAEKAAEITGLTEREIFETILQREKLGSTGVGNGIAIPHGKLPTLDRIVGVLRASAVRWSSMLSTISRWTSSSCFWRPKVRAPTI